MFDAVSAVRLLANLDQLIDGLDTAQTEQRDAIARAHPSNQRSMENLIHYLALRRHDLRSVQSELAGLGLSSLGRSEGHVLGSLVQVRARLRDSVLAADGAAAERASAASFVSPADSEELIDRHARALFGPKPSGRRVSIMVTVPDAREVTPDWAREVLAAGANCFRVNTAHETPPSWARTMATIRAEAAKLGCEARILVDLAGPKLRTSTLGPKIHVHKLKPPKDELGRVAVALVVGLAIEGSPTALAIPEAHLKQLRLGDELRFCDARGKKRTLVVSRVDPGHVEALLDQTSYLTDRTELVLHRVEREIARFFPGPLPQIEIGVRIGVDDHLWLCDPACGRLELTRGLIEIPITLPEVIPAIEVGHRVFVDDGRLEAVVVEAHPERVLLRIIRTPAGRFRIRGDMGINLPDTPTEGSLAVLSETDLENLQFALANADMVGLSFVRGPDDVSALRERLAAAPRRVGLVLKIETSAGFRRLGEVLTESLRYHSVAVMIARGDLAVEVGFDRLAELQEEILWLCEAAHVPVIWATQVLESLAKTGLPSRGEVTDAAMSERAECVMLNKGAFIVRAVQMLDSIIQRMESHQHKKTALFRVLKFS